MSGGEAVVFSRGGRLSPLSVFIFISVLWHLLQVLLFNTVFRVENPRLFVEDRGTRLVAQVLAPVQSPQVASEVSVAKGRGEPVESVDLPGPVEPPGEAFAPKALGAERLEPLSRERVGVTGPERAVELPPPALELKEEAASPYSLSGGLRTRKVLSSPPMPDYPEWALIAAVELELVIALSVDENGVPFHVFVEEGCGDSQTDLDVLEVVEGMRFEPSLAKSRGSMRWEFRLER